MDRHGIMHRTVALTCLSCAIAVLSQQTPQQGIVVNTASLGKAANVRRTALLDAAVFDDPTTYDRLMAVPLTAVFTDVFTEAIRKKGGVTSALLFDFRGGTPASRAGIEVRDPGDLDALRVGLERAVHPIALTPRNAQAMCPAEFEVAVSTKHAGTIRFWGTCIGFTVVPGAIIEKSFFSVPLAEAISSVLRKNGRAGFSSEILAQYSGVSSGIYAPKVHSAAAEDEGTTGANPPIAIKMSEDQSGDYPFWLRSRGNGQRFGPFSIWNGYECEIGGEAYVMEMERPKSASERLDRLEVHQFNASGLTLEELVSELHTRSVEVDQWGEGVQFVLRPAKTRERRNYGEEMVEWPAPVNGCNMKHLLTHIETLYRVRCIVGDKAVAVCPEEDAP